MKELVRTNNAVLITAIEALLKGADIPHMVLDRNMSVLEGSLGILPCRILVDSEYEDAARQILSDAGLAHELRPLPPGRDDAHTDDAVLGGRLRLVQKRRGHRVGHDAILLAAATGGQDGDRAADLGAGVGSAGLALAVRVPGIAVTLVERDPELAEIAAANANRNGLGSRVTAVALDITSSGEAFAEAGLMPGSMDRVLMNPPFNAPDNSSPEPGKRAAYTAEGPALAQWMKAAGRLLHSAGTVTLIWRADGLESVLASLEPAFGGIGIMPVHGRAGQPAIRILVGAAKGSRAPLRLLPGLSLNDAAGRPTAQAEAVLRHAAALTL